MVDTPRRTLITDARRVVIKLGTRAVSDGDGGIDRLRLSQIVGTIADLHSAGVEVLLVSSGAVGLGAHQLGLALPIRALVDRQAAAAVGQSQLMSMYADCFGQRDVGVAQVLVATGDFDDRARYLNIRNTLLRLLEHKVLPVINENDAVSIDELKLVDAASPVFGDNDRLSAIVASKLNADLLILLTDVPGLFDRDPTRHPDAQILRQVDGDWGGFDTGTHSSALSRGGMKTKVEAAQIAVRSGCHAVIASGLEPSALQAVLAGDEVGTWFVAREGLSARRRWIAWGTPARGSLTLDDGAVSALRRGRASLLAAGVTALSGDFSRGSVVELKDPSGAVIGRGMVSCDSTAALEWIEGHPPIEARNHDALVLREHLVLEPA